MVSYYNYMDSLGDWKRVDTDNLASLETIWSGSTLFLKDEMSRGMRFPTMWYVRPAKAQTSLRIGTVWSEPLLVPWLFYDC